MAYWLMKIRTRRLVVGQQVKARRQRRGLDRRAQSSGQPNLMKMKKGDRAFFYHSGDDKQSSASSRSSARPIPTRPPKAGEPWVVVDVKALEPLPKPVSLDAIKAEPKLKDMVLVKYTRLSVQPVTADEWKFVCKMGGLK